MARSAHLRLAHIIDAVTQMRLLLSATRHPEIQWRRIADVGNWLRHAYGSIDVDLLWAIYRDDLEPLWQAVQDLASRKDSGLPRT